MEHPLSGKTIIITGASSGIGAATARSLVRLGCNVTLAARSADKLRDVGRGVRSGLPWLCRRMSPSTRTSREWSP